MKAPERSRLLRSAAVLHRALALERRFEALAVALARAIPNAATVLDVGCGDGRVAARLRELRADLVVEGLDVQVRPSAVIAVRAFDGRTIPLRDGEADVVVLCDVLHHLEDMEGLLREAKRVSKRCVVIKDHFAESRWDAALLGFMDRVGNPAGVPQPHNYLSEREWRTLWARVQLEPAEPIARALGLYQPPFDRVFDRKLHFLARLEHAV